MKRIGLLLLVLAVLIIGYVVIQSYPQGDTFTPPAEIQLSEWNDQVIDQVIFTFPDEQMIDLEKAGDGTNQWLVNTFPASEQRVNDLFAAFAATEISSRVSTNSQNHERFEVSDKGVDLQLRNNGEVVQRIILGKSAGGESSYFRLPEQDAVYVLNGLPQYLVSSELAIWRDRELVSLSPDQIRAIRYEGEQTYQVELTESGWVAQRPSQSALVLDEEKTLSWLARFGAVQAVDFLDQDATLGESVGAFTVEEGTLTTLTKGHIFELFESEEENRLALRDENGMLYVIQEDQLNQLFLPFTELVESLTQTEEASE